MRSSLVLSAGLLASIVILGGCRGATPHATSPQSGEARLTAAKIVPRFEKVLAVENGKVTMVVRGGCVATIATLTEEIGSRDELGVHCPRQARMKQWFEGIDRTSGGVALEPVPDDEDLQHMQMPAAQLVLANGKVMRVKSKADIARLVGDVQALSAELASAEVPAPGPASPGGWQMLHVSGAAHIVFAGTPARGLLDARVSTNGHYFCAFDTTTEDGPMRATKSGYIDEGTAKKAIDEVLRPFQTMGSEDRPRASFAAGTTKGSETRADIHSTAAVFERFAPMQDALGDACLPQLETPKPPKTDI